MTSVIHATRPKSLPSYSRSQLHGLSKCATMMRRLKSVPWVVLLLAAFAAGSTVVSYAGVGRCRHPAQRLTGSSISWERCFSVCTPITWRSRMTPS